MYQLDFCVCSDAFAVAKRDGKDVLQCSFADGGLVCELLYDFDERPLVLRADARVGDRVTLVLLPHRIELWIGGTLADEEWPAGTCLFSPDTPISANMQIDMKPYTPRKTNKAKRSRHVSEC